MKAQGRSLFTSGAVLRIGVAAAVAALLWAGFAAVAGGTP